MKYPGAVLRNDRQDNDGDQRNDDNEGDTADGDNGASAGRFLRLGFGNWGDGRLRLKLFRELLRGCHVDFRRGG